VYQKYNEGVEQHNLKFFRTCVLHVRTNKYNKDGRQGCEHFDTFALNGDEDDAHGREYFRCPAEEGGSDVVVHSDDCLLQFHYPADLSPKVQPPGLPLDLGCSYWLFLSLSPVSIKFNFFGPGD
jgi:hypothetical protein